MLDGNATVCIGTNPMRADVVDGEGRVLVRIYDTDPARLGRAAAALTETLVELAPVPAGSTEAIPERDWNDW